MAEGLLLCARCVLVYREGRDYEWTENPVKEKAVVGVVAG